MYLCAMFYTTKYKDTRYTWGVWVEGLLALSWCLCHKISVFQVTMSAPLPVTPTFSLPFFCIPCLSGYPAGRLLSHPLSPVGQKKLEENCPKQIFWSSCTGQICF